MNKKVGDILNSLTTDEAKTQWWEVVNKLKSIQEATGSSVLKVPPGWEQSTFKNNVLVGLDTWNVIKILRKLLKPPPINPHTLERVPMIVTLKEDSSILNDPETTIILQEDFIQLYQSLSHLMSKKDEHGLTSYLSASPHPLPKDCRWENNTFHCGEKEINFDSKAGKYFKILTESLGLPVYNKYVYKKLEYQNPRQVAVGVKKDLADKLDREGLLQTKNRLDGRVIINPAGDEVGGYICIIK